MHAKIEFSPSYAARLRPLLPDPVFFALLCILGLAGVSASRGQTIVGGSLYVGNENSFVYGIPDVDGERDVLIDTPLALPGHVYVGHDHGWLNLPAVLEVRDNLESETARVGHSPNGLGIAILAGPEAAWTTRDALYVGHSGHGSMSVEGGAALVSRGASIGYLFYSEGRAFVSGENTRWLNTGDLVIGNEGSGYLNVATGARVQTDRLVVGDYADRFKLAELQIGNGLVQAGETVLSAHAYSVSETLLNHPDGELRAGSLVVGRAGSAALNVESGSLLRSAETVLGEESEGSGAVVVSSSRWLNTGDIRLGGAGAGTLLVREGGLVQSARVVIGPRGLLRLEDESEIDATLVAEGGLVEAADFMGPVGALILRADSILDFSGEAGSFLHFDPSSLFAWDANARLDIVGYDIGVDGLRFGEAADALTAEQLGRLYFAEFDAHAVIDAAGYVTPAVAVPEAHAASLFVGGACLIGAISLRRGGSRPRA